MWHLVRLRVPTARRLPRICCTKRLHTQTSDPAPAHKYFLSGAPLASPEKWTGELVNTPVEYTEHGARKLALLQRPQGKRWWWLIDEEGNDRRINRYQLSFQWPDTDVREYTVEELRELIQSVGDAKTAILQNIDLVELWKHFSSSGHKFGEDLITGLDVATYLADKGMIPEVQAHIIYACHKILSEKEQYFQPTSVNGYSCRDAAEVALLERQRVEKAKEEEAIEKFLEKLRILLGQTNDRGSAKDITFDAEHDMKFFKEIKEYALEDNPNILTSYVADKFLLPLGLGQRPHDAFGLLVDIGICEELDNPHLLRWDVDYEANYEECIAEAQATLQNPPADEVKHLRMNLQELPVFTVTNSLADFKEIGFSSKKEGRENWVYIHIADPSRYIDVNGVINKMAKERSLSAELPEKIFHMLPTNLSRDASLEAGREAPTCVLTIAVKAEKNGRILEYKVFWSYIKNIYNLTFSEADNVMLGRKTEDPVAKSIQEKLVQEWMDLEQFAERRRKHRIYHDAIDFALPTADVNIDFQDHTTSAGVNKPRAVISISIKPPKAYNSRGILEECMFAAGEACASYGNRWDVPVVFLLQAALPLKLDFEPSSDPLEDRIRQLSIDKLKKVDKSEKILEKMKRLSSLPPEHYSIRKGPYHGKGLAAFSPVTSPLKSYVDLINHYQLKKASLLVEWEFRNTDVDDSEITLQPPTPIFQANTLLQVIQNYQAKKTEISLLEQNSRKFWILWSIKNEVEEKRFTYFNALVIISRDDKNESLVLIRKYELEAKMTVRRKLVKGETIKVIAQHVEPFYGRLILKEYREDFGVIE